MDWEAEHKRFLPDDPPKSVIISPEASGEEKTQEGSETTGSKGKRKRNKNKKPGR